MMKRIILSILSLLLIFSLAACAGGSSSSGVTGSAASEEIMDTDEGSAAEKGSAPNEEAPENNITSEDSEKSEESEETESSEEAEVPEGSEAPEAPEAPEASKTPVDTDPAGNYELYAFTQYGYTIEASLMAAEQSAISNEDGDSAMSYDGDLSPLTCEIVLNEDGSGTMSYDGEDSPVTWIIENDRVTISDGTSDLFCPYEDGILTTQTSATTRLIFAREEADTSSIECIRTLEELDDMYKNLAERQEASQQEILKKYGLQNDDKHFVCVQYDIIFCYDLEDELGTGITIYVDCYTEEDAKACYDSYEAYAEYYEDVALDGTMVIVKQSSGNMTLEILEELYGDSKIDPK